MLHAPPTALVVHSIFSLAVAVDTLGEYNWRHHGDFSISTFNPPNGTLFSIFWASGLIWGGLRWKLKNRHGGANCIHLRCQPPLEVTKLLEPYKL